MKLRPDTPIVNSEGETLSTLRYRSLRDIEDALQWAVTDADPYREGRSSTHGSQSFTGTGNADEYRIMLREGWQHGVQDVEALEGLSTDRAEKITFVRSVGGAFPLVPAFLQGAPNSMLMPTPAPADSVRGLTLVIDACFGAHTRSETVLDYARSVMKLVAWLQAEQIETSVYVVVPITFRARKFCYVTPIRETGDILQPERIAAILHPSWLRRAWFAMVEYEYHELKLVGTASCKSGYGGVTTATAEEMQACLPEAYSVIMLPKVGDGDPLKAVQQSITLKLRQED